MNDVLWRNNIYIKNGKISEAYNILYHWSRKQGKWAHRTPDVYLILKKEMGVQRNSTVRRYLREMGKTYRIIDAQPGWIMVKKPKEIRKALTYDGIKN